MTDREIRRYLKKIISESHCPYSARKEFYARLSDDIRQHLAGHPDCSREDLYTFFGSPDEVGSQYLANLPPKILRRRLQIKKLARTFLAILCAVILIGGLVLACIFYNTWRNPGYNVITTIYYETESSPSDTIQKQIVPGNPRIPDDFPLYNIKPLRKTPTQQKNKS